LITEEQKDFKPFSSPALPRTGNGQEYWQVKFERVTLKASLISPALRKPAPDRTRPLAGAQEFSLI